MRAPGQMEIVRVDSILEEAENISTVTFGSEKESWKDFTPGQFVMVWIPGVDEVPMSLSIKNEDILGITVQNIGEATDAICKLEKGEKIGIRGPYGNGFKLPTKKQVKTIIGVSGGVGGASTILPMEWAYEKKFHTINIIGSRSKDLLLFEKRWKKCSSETYFTTDDGSFGIKGLVTDPLGEILEKMKKTDRRKTLIFSCGPEVMLSAVKELLDKYEVKGQFSLERFMKCGIGICDSCSISGKRACMDGPVFDTDQLVEMKEFGRVQRDRAGRKVHIKECVR
jgi:dihydroorotate dehydrogenase electron transfer subunit